MQALLYGTWVYGYGKHIGRSRSFRLEEGIVQGMRERSWIMSFSWYLLSCVTALECRSRFLVEICGSSRFRLLQQP